MHISNSNLLKSIGLGVISSFISCKQPEKPNILFILTDDQGSWTLSSQKNPNSYTPSLDKLVSEGAFLKNAFASSAVCSPARAALISGRYPSEAGILGVVSTGSTNGIDTSLVLWPQLFSEAGYYTALVGKWHIGHANPIHFPEQNGYQKFSGFLQNGDRSKDPIIRVEGKDSIFTGKYTSDILTDLAMDYIREFADKPWVVSLHYWAPHANTRFPDDFKPTARGRSWLPMKETDLEFWRDMDLILPEPDFPNLDIDLTKRMMREYYASVHSVDRNVGRIMKFLKDMKLDKNTIVIFTSDHGFMMGHQGLWHKGNGRWLTKDDKDPYGIYEAGRSNLFDLSLRVPCIIRWPGKVKAGSVIEETVTFLDWYPSLLEMAGINKSDNLLLRGNSIVPLLKGLKMTWDNTFYAQMSLSGTRIRCVQTPEWKYVYEFADSTKNEFYNLSVDPSEHSNLINSIDPVLAKRRDELKEMLFTKLKEINDPVLK